MRLDVGGLETLRQSQQQPAVIAQADAGQRLRQGPVVGVAAGGIVVPEFAGEETLGANDTNVSGLWIQNPTGETLPTFYVADVGLQ